MNKLILDREYYHFDNEEINIEIKKKNITIEVSNNVKINDLTSKEDINLNILVNDNATLVFNKYNKDLALSNIKLTINSNSNVKFNQSAYNTMEGKFIINTDILGNNNKCDINFYGVTNYNGKLVVDGNANVKEKVYNNDVLENLRILTLNDQENVIMPNLLVSSNEVSINHNATISNVNEDYLFYLESKGINKEDASNLIFKGFLTSKLLIDENDKENIIY